MTNFIGKRKDTRIDESYGYTDIDGASKILGLSKSKIYKACATLLIPHYKPFGKLMFKISELILQIEAGKQ